MGKDKKLLGFELDNNVGHFLYFKEKYKDILRYGVVYDLPYKQIQKLICQHASTDFGFEVDGKKIELGDLLVSKDFSIFNDKYKKSFIDTFGVVYFIMKVTLDFENNPVLELTFYDKDSNSIKEYQYYDDDTAENEIYHVNLPLGTLRVLKDMHLKETK